MTPFGRLVVFLEFLRRFGRCDAVRQHLPFSLTSPNAIDPVETFSVFLLKVFERYGHQQGALRGPNPRKHGRPSHHPLVAALAEAHFLLRHWLRSGRCDTARGAVEFLKEAPALLPEKLLLRVVRAEQSLG